MSASDPTPRGVAAKLILVLHELAAHREPTGVTHLSRRTRLPKTTVHRLLADLEAAGVVHRAGRRYALAQAPAWQDPAPVRESRLRKVLKPYLLELYERSGHVVSLATANGDTARFLDLLYPHRFTEAILRTAASVPLHCTATGKALLAFDPDAAERYLREADLTPLTRNGIATRDDLDQAIVEVRLRGVALDREEHLLGFWGVAAPVTGRRGTALAAVGLAGPVRSFQPAEHVAHLRSVARAASAAVRGLD
ncbi:IclR family transcriptional regulator [Glycomyces paridis]|uniref:IclR family transcriptional regulator n=1 Tax=Glycomyces paridis TaxID=2126555 RepID=A0A4S8PJK1_9ACTN|nr:IclR family transcriptional regulator [Glycomyces paridis]THV30873.1 IclR family transcriptional regulator [Glycomyces paridis]